MQYSYKDMEKGWKETEINTLNNNNKIESIYLITFNMQSCFHILCGPEYMRDQLVMC